ncbi:hypothetical protein BDQ12DRAFT_214090 [Crucibulum laeve]|uniref:Uncharacterized protein n=1 Tax=Crucibulum laeve TaxID=68775 RepID=A0A5C3LWX3_9AGAR|nr:hypothetical protein BDQ12DRAFT_214090 [Crucibulum laeve]
MPDTLCEVVGPVLKCLASGPSPDFLVFGIPVGLGSIMVVLGNSILRHAHASHAPDTDAAALYGAIGGFAALIPMALFWFPIIIWLFDYKNARALLCWLCCITFGISSGLAAQFIFDDETAERLWENIKSLDALRFLDVYWATCAGGVGGGIIGTIFLLSLLFDFIRVFFASCNFRMPLPSSFLRSCRQGNKSASQSELPLTNLGTNMPVAINPPPPSYSPESVSYMPAPLTPASSYDPHGPASYYT